jgi:hypothetical protein
MSYAANASDLDRRAATYVDKIKAPSLADLPVEQPTKFEFIINLKAAKQIGLTIPPNVLARADRSSARIELISPSIRSSRRSTESSIGLTLWLRARQLAKMNRGPISGYTGKIAAFGGFVSLTRSWQRADISYGFVLVGME